MAKTTTNQRRRRNAPPALRVSQIEVHLVLLNEHDVILREGPAVFQNDANGTAADHLAEWAKNGLPVQLELAGAQMVTQESVDAAVPGAIDTMTKAQLREIAHHAGIQVSGNRAELIARIEAHREAGSP